MRSMVTSAVFLGDRGLFKMARMARLDGETPEGVLARTTKRGTVVFEKHLNLSVQAAFDAWTRPVALHLRRDRAGNLFSYVSFDFRPGGETVFAFGTPEGHGYRATLRYEDIIEDSRISYVLTIKRGNRLVYLGTVTVAFRQTADGCMQTYTEQGTRFDSEPMPDHLQWYAERLFGERLPA